MQRFAPLFLLPLLALSGAAKLQSLDPWPEEQKVASMRGCAWSPKAPEAPESEEDTAATCAIGSRHRGSSCMNLPQWSPMSLPMPCIGESGFSSG